MMRVGHVAVGGSEVAAQSPSGGVPFCGRLDLAAAVMVAQRCVVCLCLVADISVDALTITAGTMRTLPVRTSAATMMVHTVRRRGPPNIVAAAEAPTTMANDWIDRGVPKWVTLIDEALFVMASAAFIRGSLDFFPGVPIQRYIEGINIFFAGSAIYTILAIFAAYEIIEDAKLEGKPAEAYRLFEQTLYVLGSIFFLAGTALFTPPLESTAEPGTNSELVLSVLGQTYYLATGAVPEVAESALASGDELFIIGSVLFSVAAFVSALFASAESNRDDRASVLRREAAVATASLFELGGLSFVIGTLGFYPPGPLGMETCPMGTVTLETLGAWLFVGGSVCYTAGSVIILAFEAWLTYRRGGDE